jgi:hypothetical protein
MKRQLLPRRLKYAWAAVVSLLLVISVLVEDSSKWQPLINQAIDMLQLQASPPPAR